MIFIAIPLSLATINVLVAFVYSRRIKDWKPLKSSLIESSIYLTITIILMEAANVQ